MRRPVESSRYVYGIARSRGRGPPARGGRRSPSRSRCRGPAHSKAKEGGYTVDPHTSHDTRSAGDRHRGTGTAATGSVAIASQRLGPARARLVPLVSSAQAVAICQAHHPRRRARAPGCPGRARPRGRGGAGGRRAGWWWVVRQPYICLCSQPFSCTFICRLSTGCQHGSTAPAPRRRGRIERPKRRDQPGRDKPRPGRFRLDAFARTVLWLE